MSIEGADMLKRVEIPNYGSFVFGRKRPAPAPEHRRMKSTPMGLISLPEAMPASEDLIKAAALALAQAEYAAQNDILANDQYGDCTCAGALHLEALFQALLLKGRFWRQPSKSDALWLYSQVTHPAFNPFSGANDNGANEQDVLNFWEKNGIFSDMTGKISSWSAVDARNEAAVKQAIIMNHNLYLGVELPDAWLQQAQNNPVNYVWDVAGDPNPENGHCVVGVGYTAQGVQVNSWGGLFTITWAALAKYCTPPTGELYTVVAA